MKHLFVAMTALIGVATVATAEAPSVAVDIAPTHALVATVMQGVGTPNLLIQPGVSPHGYSMRPSEARALQDADVVFWIGHALTPSLEKPIETLTSDAKIIELMDLSGVTKLPFREGAAFEHHEDDHDDHDDHEKDAEHHQEDAHDDHDHEGGIDPHIWLDPANASVWLSEIAETLAAIDPENAAVYRENADRGRDRIATMIDDINHLVAPVRGRGFVVFHDAYYYFEERFELQARGAILVSDGAAPSAARLKEIRAVFEEKDVTCVFSEPQFNAKIVDAVVAQGAVNSAILDPLGATLEVGPELYETLIRNLASNIATCLKE